MSQLNFNIPNEAEKFLKIMGEHENMSKSAYAKKIFMDAVNLRMMPYYALLYKKGEISIKKIARNTGIHFTKVIHEIAILIDDIIEDEDLFQKTSEMNQKLLSQFQGEMKKKQINFDAGVN